MTSPPNSQPRSSRNRTLQSWQWREGILERVGLGLAVAHILLAALGYQRSHQASELGTVAVVACALLSACIGQWSSLSYRIRASGLCLLASVAAVLLDASLPTLWPTGALLGLTSVALGGLLLSMRHGIFLTAFYLGGSVLAWSALGAQSRLGVTPPWPLHGVGFAVASLTCLWWVDFGVRKIQHALVQREELVQFVRQETEERIAQLEKQQSLERQLRQSQKMEALGTLAGGIAHDFNNLLLVIASGAQSAREAPPEELAEILGEIRDAAARGGSLTNQLLAFGRRKINERGAIHLNREVENSIQLIRRLIPSNVHLHFEPSPEVQTIEAAAVDIDQVIMNLCINARDAMPRGGDLWIETRLYQVPGHVSSEAVISVRDTGMGMSQEALERAFEPFFTTKQTGAGTGLGLSVVDTIVRNHKGRLEIDSEEGRGSEFRVFFPHYEQGLPLAPSSERRSSTRGGERLLLVDDDAAVRKGIARVLRRAGYDVVVASDGVEALRIYGSLAETIELVVTDAVMPKMGGRDLCEAISRVDPDQACLICSGYDAGTIEEGFFVSEGREFLAKPFDNDQLLNRIRALLDLRYVSDHPKQSRTPPA